MQRCCEDGVEMRQLFFHDPGRLMVLDDGMGEACAWVLCKVHARCGRWRSLKACLLSSMSGHLFQ